MFYTLTLTTRDYALFTITADEASILTACQILSSGLQMRQQISVLVSATTGSASIAELRNASQLTQAVTDCITFLNSRFGGEK